MTAKKLIGMVVALGVLVAIAILQKHGGISGPSKLSGKQTTLFAGIDLNTVTSINVENGSNSVELVKPDGKWTIASLYDYPADFGNLAETIRSAAEVELGSPVRAGNVADSEYGLGTGAKKVVLKAGDKAVVSIEIGAKRNGSDTTADTSEFFIRLNDDPSIYLVDYDFESFPDIAEDWMDKQLLSVRPVDLIGIKTDDVDLQLDGAAWKLADLDPATEEFQSPVANRLRSGLQFLSCDSVADPAMSDKDLGFDIPAHYSARTREGFTYSVTLGAKTDKGRYVRIAVGYEKPEPPTAPADDAEQATQDEYKQALEAYNSSTVDNARMAKELTGKLSGWTYVLGNYAANSLTVPRSELVTVKSSQTDKNDSPTPPTASLPSIIPSVH